jgi:hypothetical protein
MCVCSSVSCTYRSVGGCLFLMKCVRPVNLLNLTSYKILHLEILSLHARLFYDMAGKAIRGGGSEAV